MKVIRERSLRPAGLSDSSGVTPEAGITWINPPRYAEKRWKLVIGAYQGLERAAVDELQKAVQTHLPYVLEVRRGADLPDLESGANVILVGTAQSNPWIGRALEQAQLPSPPAPQGYTLAGFPSPWKPEERVLLVSGWDEAGVWYGVQELKCLLVAHSHELGMTWSIQPQASARPLDLLGDFSHCDFPRVARRGIWTWGYVVYDYRRFLDHMAELKMNWWILWNDVPPLNAPQVIEYAHQRGIEVVFGYAWGWGLDGLSLADLADRRAIAEAAVAAYRQHYASLRLDGIYFQTLTEHHDTRIQGKSVASLTCTLVNEIAAELLRINPDLPIYFGLHATSIQQDYPDLVGLDPRVVIVWEDAGGIPYLYEPALPPDQTPEAALEYSKKLAALRPGLPFALVPKGWSNLDWQNEFEHHGPYILGERSAEFIHRRLQAKQPLWDWRNALWDRYYPLAARFYREMLAAAPAGLMAAGLVEDGLFEARIQSSVALFAEMLWNPQRSDEELLRAALRVRRAPPGAEVA